MLIQISQEVAPKGPIDSLAAFVQIMAWCPKNSTWTNDHLILGQI